MQSLSVSDWLQGVAAQEPTKLFVGIPVAFALVGFFSLILSSAKFLSISMRYTGLPFDLSCVPFAKYPPTTVTALIRPFPFPDYYEPRSLRFVVGVFLGAVFVSAGCHAYLAYPLADAILLGAKATGIYLLTLGTSIVIYRNSPAHP